MGSIQEENNMSVWIATFGKIEVYVFHETDEWWTSKILLKNAAQITVIATLFFTIILTNTNINATVELKLSTGPDLL